LGFLYHFLNEKVNLAALITHQLPGIQVDWLRKATEWHRL